MPEQKCFRSFNCILHCLLSISFVTRICKLLSGVVPIEIIIHILLDNVLRQFLCRYMMDLILSIMCSMISFMHYSKGKFFFADLLLYLRFQYYSLPQHQNLSYFRLCYSSKENIIPISELITNANPFMYLDEIKRVLQFKEVIIVGFNGIHKLRELTFIGFKSRHKIEIVL